ncbi:urease accessory protein UreJ [Methyloceanibacter methanicus]|uniref:Urease accessory protein UreJ n=1 Tax=Methyloceanibacter methanicus TaxID=1774968 RepID=A0A1E3W7L8_9HYPH|nr:HupE/UreJ family protein [Methyloceanibacter methanicus]ODS01097.1 urease accessory protein UreJ [Methyloceanibacter methanicus]
MTTSSLHRIVFLALAALVLTAAPASAHHMMGGEMPSTFSQGLLSGLGHPVIGLDHLAFLIAVGVAVGVGGLNLGLPVLFVAASAIGVGIHVGGFDLPGAELIVASSVVIVGALVASGRALPLAAWAALFGAAGLAHGYAYGESIFGAEPTPLAAYLLGLVIIQSVLSVGVALLFRVRTPSVSAIAPRLAGAVVVGIGIAALLGQIIPDA